MDNKKTGDFICKLRKQKNLTQKQLADKLGITDKAVSKWERGVGYPDISMLHPLADALETSINEIIEGEAHITSSDLDTKTIDIALDYADKIISNKENKLGKIISAVIAISLCITIFTCIIVNVALSLNLTWSIIVIASCIMSGCLLIPPLLWKTRGLYISLISLTAFLLPFLAVVEYEVSVLIGYSGWLWKLGFPISLIWLAFLWIMVMVKKIKINIWFYICIGLILCIPCNLLTNYAVDQFVDVNIPVSQQISNISTALGFATVAVLFFIIGLLRNNKH